MKKQIHGELSTLSCVKKFSEKIKDKIIESTITVTIQYPYFKFNVITIRFQSSKFDRSIAIEGITHHRSHSEIWISEDCNRNVEVAFITIWKP
jgi:hypothetical protein